MQKIVIDNKISTIADELKKMEHTSVFILTDTNTHRLCLPELMQEYAIDPTHVITIEADCPIEAEIIWAGGRKIIRANM